MRSNPVLYNALLAAALLAVASAQSAPITALPGLATLPPFKMYSGYVPYTSPTFNSTHYTFHWVAESQGNPATDPILFWTNGGPGCSGLYGMGFENGPFVAYTDGTLQLSPMSWNRFATVVWIEQPAGVGFSYSSQPSDYDAYDDASAALDNAAFLTAFFAMYPQYAKLDLYLTSESYGGNYVPQWTAAVLAGADRRLAAQLKGFSVNNPVFSLPPLNGQNRTFANIKNLVLGEIMYGNKLAPRWAYEQFVENGCETFEPTPLCDTLRDQLVRFGGDCYAGNACGDNMWVAPSGNGTLGVEVDSVNHEDAAWDAYLSRADVQAAIHAKPPHAGGDWVQCGGIGYHVTWPSSLDTYGAAFAAGLKVLVFSGDGDATTCPFSGTQVAIMALTDLPGAAITANWTSWSVNGQTAGYIERHGAAFTFATVKGAGHEAPGFQPYATYTLVSSFVAGTLDELAAPPPPPTAPRRPRGPTQGSILNRLVNEELERQRGLRA